MNQALALEILLSGESALLTGPAGSGKTYVLNQFIKYARADGKSVAVTATTGLAATHIGGNTIHAWSGIGIHNSLPTHFEDEIHKGRRDTILKTDILIIDEISMLHDFRLDMVDEVARTIRERDEPFGGIQVVLCGDFFQLPPVSRGNEEVGKFVVESDVWQALDPVICYLGEQHRQDDDEYLQILQALRANDIRRHHAERLLGQIDIVLDDVTELHTTNINVDTINARRLAQLPGPSHTYSMSHTGKDTYVESLKKSCLANEELVLKKGALVMTIKNNPEKRYVNGSLGTVVGFEKNTNYPLVELKNGRKITITPETWELRDGDKKRASLSQLPLRLAWAITIHKSQGMTLDAARIDLRRAFVEGMGYVALSRVRSLKTLSLLGINRMALQVSPEALRIDGMLRQKSQEDSKRFAHLQKDADARAASPKPEKKNTGWSEKVTTMREKYPNAYKPWSEKDDKELMQLFSKKQSINVEKLTKKFGRHPGSIRARLKKHFGDDAID